MPVRMVTSSLRSWVSVNGFALGSQSSLSPFLSVCAAVEQATNCYPDPGRSVSAHLSGRVSPKAVDVKAERQNLQRSRTYLSIGSMLHYHRSNSLCIRNDT